MADRVLDLKKDIKNAANIGCGRGFVSKHILAESIEHLLICDTSEKMLEQAEGTPGLKMKKVHMDEEDLELDENSLDLVISSLSLHWVNDLPRCFQRIMKSLKPDGVFIASLFGGDTLFELRSSLQLAELERKGGLSAHISPFTKIRDIGGLLNRAGFTMLTIDTDEIVVGYPSIFELMGDLKGMAENNAAFNRPLNINKDVLMAAGAIYRELYAKEEGINATYQIIYLVGWKPSPNQPQPLARGSGEISLKDLGNIIEQGGKTQTKNNK